ncbi:MAG: hypothetical protein NWE89_15270 [Candidatus Bathyarchaeota archaeon]|nr:hypothetical protein [Candidatus Bathyarchaeota archaeon]
MTVDNTEGDLNMQSTKILYSRDGDISHTADCRQVCQKRLNFFALLPDEIIIDALFCSRLVTVVICRNCSYRLFTLPNYAIERESIQQFMSLWRNLDIFVKMYYSEIEVKKEETIEVE